MTPLLLELKPSRTLAAVLFGLHVSAGVCAAATLGGGALVISLLGITLSCAGCVGDALRLWPSCPVRIRLDEDTGGRWTDRRGEVRTASSVVVSQVAAWLVILGLRQSRYRTRWVLVPADALSGEDHRKLRRWARWRSG